MHKKQIIHVSTHKQTSNTHARTQVIHTSNTHKQYTQAIHTSTLTNKQAIHTCKYTHTNTHILTCSHSSTHKQTDSTHTHTIRTHSMHANTRAVIHMHRHTYAHTHTNTHTHTHVHPITSICVLFKTLTFGIHCNRLLDLPSQNYINYILWKSIKV